jgi:hypothetical protein
MGGSAALRGTFPRRTNSRDFDIARPAARIPACGEPIAHGRSSGMAAVNARPRQFGGSFSRVRDTAIMTPMPATIRQTMRT